MNPQYLTLAGRIREELSDIEQIVNRIDSGWERAQQSGDEFYLDGVALNLHSFYTALERIFELIASTVDRIKPQGENWHQELLRQMATEIELVRPADISRKTRDTLDEYRGFRHVVRNRYSFNLSSSKMEPLVNKLPKLVNEIQTELDHFLNFLLLTGRG